MAALLRNPVARTIVRRYRVVSATGVDYGRRFPTVDRAQVVVDRLNRRAAERGTTGTWEVR